MGLLVTLAVVLFMVFAAFSAGCLDRPTTYRMLGSGLDLLIEEPTIEKRTAIARTPAAPQLVKRYVTPLINKNRRRTTELALSMRMRATPRRELRGRPHRPYFEGRHELRRQSTSAASIMPPAQVGSRASAMTTEDYGPCPDHPYGGGGLLIAAVCRAIRMGDWVITAA